MQILSFFSLILALGAIVALVLFGLRLRDSSRRLKELQAQVHSLTENLNALCSGAVGVDQRVSNLERSGRDLVHRQESIESSQPDRPYGEAIQMVQQGATASVLVQELGLSRSEADLVVMLHGSK